MTSTSQSIAAEASRRRTFAIISHPDAGKTTLTEKLLLYGGAIRLAGRVRSRRGEKGATSDWMSIERERGITVSTSVLHFPYRDAVVNLLDTPGHNDFSEDTYRTLAAADCAVMLIDCAKGVEPQTVKLFEVCRLRRIPIVTFINKMDRHGRDPIAVLDEVERILGIPTSPANWPLGSGDTFRGVFDRWSQELLYFDRGAGGGRPVPVAVQSLTDAAALSSVPDALRERLVHDLDLLEGAGTEFERDLFLRGELTPVFFGSALTNFGVERFLDRFIDLCPPPSPRTAEGGPVPVDQASFSGFVFKIQANMDRLHRDRIAFVRVCAGRFAPDTTLRHGSSGREITAGRVLRVHSRQRETLEEAYPGDIIGVWDSGALRIGDTIYETEPVRYEGIPRFSPEHFAQVKLRDPFRRKQLKKGLEQLSEEGAVQLFFDRDRLEREPVLGAVGLLQFDVVMHRLREEYGVDASLETLPFRYARWIASEGVDLNELGRRLGTSCLLDLDGRPVLLFREAFHLRSMGEDCPDIQLLAAVQPARQGAAGKLRRSAS